MTADKKVADRVEYLLHHYYAQLSEGMRNALENAIDIAKGAKSCG